MSMRSYSVRLEAEYSGFVQAMQGAADAVDKVGQAADKASKRVDLATVRQRDAAGRLRTAEAQLEAARAKHPAQSAQVVAAEEKVAKARRDQEKATEELVAAEASLRAETSRTSSALDQMSAHISANEEHINKLSNALGLLGGAMTLFAGIAVKRFADFDAAMSSVQAATMESAGSMALLREAAIDAGASTAFSAVEAADAIEQLAKAGVSTEAILSGGLSGTLNLAASDNIAVGDAAEYAAAAMVQFGLAGSDVGHIADLMAAGAGKALGGVADLGEALSNVGVVAANTGLSIEETTGFLAAMASYGLIGAQAGTQLKSMLQSLQNPSSVAARAMDELNLSLYDSAGNTKSLTQFVGEYQAALSGKTQAERDSYAATIFGSYGINAATVAYKEGADGIQGWIDAVDDQGYAAEQARIRLDNLKGDIEGLSGSIETAFIRSGSGANDVLRGMVQGADSVVDAIGRIPEPVLSATTMLVGGGGLVALGLAGFGKLAIGANDVRIALQGLNVSFKTAATTAGIAGTAIGVAAAALAVWATNAANAKAAAEEYKATLDDVGNATERTADTLSDRLSGRSVNWWDDFVNRGKSAVDLLGEIGIAAEDARGYVEGNAGATERVTKAMQEYSDAAGFWDQQYGGRSSAVAKLTGWLDEERDALERGKRELADKNALDGEAAEGSDTLASSMQAVTEAASQQLTAMQEASEALQEWRDMVGEADASFVDLAGAFQTLAAEAESAAGNASAAWDAVATAGAVSTDKWIEQLRKQAEAQAQWRDNLLAATAQVRDEMPANMQAAADAMLDEWISLGAEGAPMLQNFVDANAEQRAEIVTLWAGTGEDIASELETARKPKIEVEVDGTTAEQDLAMFLASTEGSSATMVIDADGDPAWFEAQAITTQINEAEGTITLFADDGRALTTLADYTASVDAASGEVTITGNDAQGRTATVTLTGWVGQQSGSISVGANTGGAESDVSGLLSWVSTRVASIIVRATMPDLDGAAVSGSGRPGFAEGGHTPPPKDGRPTRVLALSGAFQ